jgi:hypothetical protein
MKVKEYYAKNAWYMYLYQRLNVLDSYALLFLHTTKKLSFFRLVLAYAGVVSSPAWSQPSL